MHVCEETNGLKAECGKCGLKVTVDIKCLACKMTFKSTNTFRDFVVNMGRKRSVKEAFEGLFENETLEKYNCIGCMKSVLASKKWNLLSTPEVLCLSLSHHHSNIKIDRELILKCSTDTKIRYWKYDLVTVTDHADNSKVQEEYESEHLNRCKLFYERIEEVKIDEPIPTIIIDVTDSEISSDDEIQIVNTIETEIRNTAVIIDQCPREGKMEFAEKEPNSSKSVYVRERSQRIVNRNHQLLASSVKDNGGSLESSGMDKKKDGHLSAMPDETAKIAVPNRPIAKSNDTTTDQQLEKQVHPDLTKDLVKCAQLKHPVPRTYSKIANADRERKNSDGDVLAMPDETAKIAVPNRPIAKSNDTTTDQQPKKQVRSDLTKDLVKCVQISRAVPRTYSKIANADREPKNSDGDVLAMPDETAKIAVPNRPIAKSNDTTTGQQPKKQVRSDLTKDLVKCAQLKRPVPRTYSKIANADRERKNSDGDVLAMPDETAKIAVPNRPIAKSNDTTTVQQPKKQVRSDLTKDLVKCAQLKHPVLKTYSKIANADREPKNSDGHVLAMPDETAKIAVSNRSIQKNHNKTTKPKNFVRLRFQIDCRAAADVNVDQLIIFLKETMKIDGKTNNLSRVEINRHNSDVNILSKVPLKKKYLKLLAKKYLKKKKQSHFHVIKKNERAYKIILK